MKALAGSVKLAMHQGTGSSPGKPTGSMQLPEGPAMASMEPRGASAYPPLGMTASWGRESDRLSFGIPPVEGACHLLKLGDGLLEGVDSLAPWIPVARGP